MSKTEYRDSAMGECHNCCLDCKCSADYAAFNFKQKNEEEARRYVANLEANLASLKAALCSLDYANREIKKEAK